MIDWSVSRHGHAILKISGLSVCSTVDPAREATKWCEANLADAHLFDRIVIVGLGAGYHVLSAMKMVPSEHLLVVTDSDDLLASVKRNQPTWPEALEVVVATSTSDLLRQAGVRRLLRQIFKVLIFAPACAASPLIHREIYHCLLGRDPALFPTLVAGDEDLRQTFPLTSVSEMNGRGVTIKDLAGWARAEASPASDLVRGVLSLAELVK